MEPELLGLGVNDINRYLHFASPCRCTVGDGQKVDFYKFESNVNLVISGAKLWGK